MNNPYYTHRPYLQKELDLLIPKIDNKKINILELGVGDGSSELFHKFAQLSNNISIIGIETDIQWANQIKTKYSLNNYEIKWIKTWDIDIYKNINNKFYDLVFIDQSPWEARIEALDYLSDTNAFTTAILHDYDYYNSTINKYDIGSNSFFSKYLDQYELYAYYQELPPTLIFKNRNILP